MRKLVKPLSAIAILVIIFGTIYATAQQSQRSDANFPQTLMAEDTATRLNNGRRPQDIISLDKFDISKSLSPFINVYDKDGSIVAGDGYLNNKLPKIPIGVLKAANGKDYNAVTWQPQSDVRMAVVSVAAKDYYVVSGRSLSEVEKNESMSLKISMLGGVASLIVLGLAYLIHKNHRA